MFSFLRGSNIRSTQCHVIPTYLIPTGYVPNEEYAPSVEYYGDRETKQRRGMK
jgi:hypothetical protein